MLEQIRESSQGFWAKAILVVIALTFVLAGIGSYITNDIDQAAVKVNGDEISTNAIEQAYQSERARLESQFGEAFSQLAASDTYLATLRQNVVDRLVADKLLEQQAESFGLRASDDQVKEAILAAPEFQLGGVFNNERYLALIRQSGFSPSDFSEFMRTDMTRRQFAIALTASEFGLPNESEQLVSLQQQTRDGRYAIVNAADFNDDVDISEEEINNYYQENLALYDTQEKVKVSFIEVRSSDLKADIEVTDEDVQEYYDNNLDLYQTEEQRRVSHILVEFGEDEAVAQEKINATLTRVEAGEDFAELAKELSDDVVSAEIGGDLDWISEGAFDPVFETAAFNLESVSDVSEVVKSDFGFHIIKLTDIKEGSVQAIETVSANVKTLLTQEKASDAFFSIQEEVAQIAFESPDDLTDVAEVAQVEIQQSELFDRFSAPFIFNRADILETIFDADLVEEGLNSDVIEVGDEHIVVVNIDEYEPERTKSLSEVKEQIVQSLTDEKAKEVAREWATTIRDAVSQQQDVEGKFEEKSISWQDAVALGRFSADAPSAITSELFKLSSDSSLSIVDTADGNIAIVQLNKVNNIEDIEPSELIATTQRLTSQIGQTVYVELVDALKSQGDIKELN